MNELEPKNYLTQLGALRVLIMAVAIQDITVSTHYHCCLVAHTGALFRAHQTSHSLFLFQHEALAMLFPLLSCNATMICDAKEKKHKLS